MKRPLSGLALLPLLAVGALLTACDPGTRYVDQVFASSTSTTRTYATLPDLVTGALTAQKLDIYQPTGDTLTNRPVIVWIHGGGFKAGNRADLASVADAYARRGYVTVSIDYRLDRGNRCQDLQDGRIPPEDIPAEQARCTRAIETAQSDAETAIRWVRDHAKTLKVDTTRVAVGGSSAGAVTALNVAERANPDHGTVPADVRVGAALAMSGCQYDPASIDAHDAPISLLHAGGDQAVPYACAVATANAAEAVGTDVQRIFFPTESGHARGLYGTHQAEVDAQWTRFLVEHLDL